MEHAIGTKITLEVVETEETTTCDGCFFKHFEIRCCEIVGECISGQRTDRKNIIYKEIKEDTK